MSKRVLYREYDNEGNLIKLECSHCHEIKTVDNFYNSKKEKDGKYMKCKSCIKEYNIKYREEHKEEINKYQQQYSKKNKEKKRESDRKYRENNKDIIKEKQRKYRENNKEKIKETNKRYYENNREKIYKQNMEYKHKNREKNKLWQANYNNKNKEKIREINRIYRENNRELLREKGQQYVKNNKEKIHEYGRQYRENNKEKVKERNRQYREINKDRIREKGRQFHKNKANQEIIKIYKNVTKNLYPNNGIQYGIIYGVHCISTDRWYIGQTTIGFKNRYEGNFFKYKHNELSEDSEKGKLLQKDIEKYGEENFEIFEVLDVAFSEKELDEKEAYYIDYYKAYDEGYNSNRGNIFKHNKSKRKEVI